MDRRKTVLITGANKGIGFEIARQCGKAGLYVIISGRNEQRLEEALALLKKEKIEAELLLMDISHAQSIEQAAAGFASKRLDVLINNAGILLKGDRDLLHDDEEILQQTITSNSIGPLRVCRAFLPHMQPGARVIMLSSGGGSMTDPVGGWSPAYCVSKTLLNAITRQLAYDLAERKISVNAVCPGWVKTDMGGMGAPRSLAKGAETPVWLATEAPQSYTGMFFRDKKEIPW